MNLNKAHYLVKKKLPSKINGYKVEKEICRLSEGKIYLAKNLLTFQNVLLKVYNKEIIQYQNQLLTLINNEIFLFKYLSHKNILQLYEVIESKTHIILVFENFQGEKLSDKLKKISRFDEDNALYIFMQIIEMLTYVHSLNIAHLNINIDVFMIDSKNNIKICDFKYGILYKEKEKISVSYKQLENMFSCPEIHIRKPFIPVLADVWSSGVLLYNVLTGETPFNNINNLQLTKSIIKAEYFIPENTSKEFIELFNSLLDYREDKRFKLEDIYNSAIFKIKNIPKPQPPLGYSIPVNKEVLNFCKNNYNIKPVVAEKNINEYDVNKTTSIYKQVINQIRKDKKDFGMKDYTDEDNILKKNIDSYLQQQEDNKKKNNQEEEKITANQKNILKALENIKVKYLLHKKNKEIAIQNAEKIKNEQNAQNAQNAQNSQNRKGRLPKFFSKQTENLKKKRNSVFLLEPKAFGGLHKANSNMIKQKRKSQIRKISDDMSKIIEEEEVLMIPSVIGKGELEQQIYLRQINDNIQKQKEKDKDIKMKKNREEMKIQYMNNTIKNSKKKVRNIDEEIKKEKIEKIKRIKSLEKKNEILAKIKDLSETKDEGIIQRRKSIMNFNHIQSKIGKIFNDNKSNNAPNSSNKYLRKRKSVSISGNFFFKNKLSKNARNSIGCEDKILNRVKIENQLQDKIKEINITNKPDVKKENEEKKEKEKENDINKANNKEENNNENNKEENKENENKKRKKKDRKNRFKTEDLDDIEDEFDKINSCKKIMDEIFEEAKKELRKEKKKKKKLLEEIKEKEEDDFDKINACKKIIDEIFEEIYQENKDNKDENEDNEENEESEDSKNTISEFLKEKEEKEKEKEEKEKEEKDINKDKTEDNKQLNEINNKDKEESKEKEKDNNDINKDKEKEIDTGKKEDIKDDKNEIKLEEDAKDEESVGVKDSEEMNEEYIKLGLEFLKNLDDNNISNRSAKRNRNKKSRRKSSFKSSSSNNSFSVSDNRSETDEIIEEIKDGEEDEDANKEKINENHNYDLKKNSEEKNKNRSQIMLRGLGIEEIKEIQNEESSECRSQIDDKKSDINDKINMIEEEDKDNKEQSSILSNENKSEFTDNNNQELNKDNKEKDKDKDKDEDKDKENIEEKINNNINEINVENKNENNNNIETKDIVDDNNIKKVEDDKNEINKEIKENKDKDNDKDENDKNEINKNNDENKIENNENKVANLINDEKNNDNNNNNANEKEKIEKDNDNKEENNNKTENNVVLNEVNDQSNNDENKEKEKKNNTNFTIEKIENINTNGLDNDKKEIVNDKKEEDQNNLVVLKDIINNNNENDNLVKNEEKNDNDRDKDKDTTNVIQINKNKNNNLNIDHVFEFNANDYNNLKTVKDIISYNNENNDDENKEKLNDINNEKEIKEDKDKIPNINDINNNIIEKSEIKNNENENGDNNDMNNKEENINENEKINKDNDSENKLKIKIKKKNKNNNNSNIKRYLDFDIENISININNNENKPNNNKDRYEIESQENQISINNDTKLNKSNLYSIGNRSDFKILPKVESINISKIDDSSIDKNENETINNFDKSNNISIISNTNYKTYQHLNNKNNYVIQNVKKLEIKTPNNTSLIGYSNLTINTINTERTNTYKAKSTERRGSLKICNYNDFYILGRNAVTKREKNILKNRNYKLGLNTNKTSENSNNSILKKNLEIKGNKNRKPMNKYNTSNNFYKIPNQKALLRNKINKKKNIIRNIYNDITSLKNLEKDIRSNNDLKLNNKANNNTSILKKKKNNTYINNNISMFNLHFNNNTNKSNNDSTFSSNLKNPSIEEKKKTIRIEDENDTEEENEVDKTNNFFNLINMINYATKKKNKPEKKNDFEFEFINSQSIKNYNRSYYDQKNYKSIKDYIKDVQLRNNIKANKNKIKTYNIIKKNFYAERRRLNSHNNRYHSTGKRKLYIPEYNKSKDSLTLIKTKTNRDTFNVIKNFNTNTNPRYNALTYYVPEKFELSIKPRTSKSNTKINTNTNSKKKGNHNMLGHNVTENYSSFHSSKNSELSDIIQRRFLSNKKKIKHNKEEIEYLESDEIQNEEENENENENEKNTETEKTEIANYNKSVNISTNKSNDEKDEDKDEADYMFNNISTIKKFENNMAETIKNKLKLKLISVTDDLKNENDEEKLKYYIGPIDLSLISLKGNLKDSIEDLKYRFTEKGFEYKEDDSENTNGIKLIKDDVIYMVKVVKIRNNLLYYLFTKENKNKNI